jgi:hypothetical protein
MKQLAIEAFKANVMWIGCYIVISIASTFILLAIFLSLFVLGITDRDTNALSYWPVTLLTGVLIVQATTMLYLHLRERGWRR